MYDFNLHFSVITHNVLEMIKGKSHFFDVLWSHSQTLKSESFDFSTVFKQVSHLGISNYVCEVRKVVHLMMPLSEEQPKGRKRRN